MSNSNHCDLKQDHVDTMSVKCKILEPYTSTTTLATQQQQNSLINEKDNAFLLEQQNLSNAANMYYSAVSQEKNQVHPFEYQMAQQQQHHYEQQQQQQQQQQHLHDSHHQQRLLSLQQQQKQYSMQHQLQQQQQQNQKHLLDMQQQQKFQLRQLLYLQNKHQQQYSIEQQQKQLPYQNQYSTPTNAYPTNDIATTSMSSNANTMLHLKSQPTHSLKYIQPRAEILKSNNHTTITEKYIGKYKLIKTIGKGNFAKVKLAIHLPTGLNVAIKIIEKNNLNVNNLDKLHREVRILQLLDHPNIIKLIQVLETERALYLVMEYASNGELYDYVIAERRLSENDARMKFRQILSAVEYCHRKGIVHRDLKAENLLLDEHFNIKIADFGFANEFVAGVKLNTFCGSPPYAAPELFQGKKYDGAEADVWSLGVVLFTLVVGSFPFDGNTVPELCKNVQSGKFKIPLYLTAECERLIRRILVTNPEKRPNVQTILNDNWINIGFLDNILLPYVESKESQLDTKAIECLISMGYQREEIEFLLSMQIHNTYSDLHASYFLLKSNLNRTVEDEKHVEAAANDNKNIFKSSETQNVKSNRNYTAISTATKQTTDSWINRSINCAIKEKPPIVMAGTAICATPLTVEYNADDNAARTSFLYMTGPAINNNNKNALKHQYKSQPRDVCISAEKRNRHKVGQNAMNKKMLVSATPTNENAATLTYADVVAQTTTTATAKTNKIVASKNRTKRESSGFFTKISSHFCRRGNQ